MSTYVYIVITSLQEKRGEVAFVCLFFIFLNHYIPFCSAMKARADVRAFSSFQKIYIEISVAVDSLDRRDMYQHSTCHLFVRIAGQGVDLQGDLV